MGPSITTRKGYRVLFPDKEISLTMDILASVVVPSNFGLRRNSRVGSKSSREQFAVLRSTSTVSTLPALLLSHLNSEFHRLTAVFFGMRIADSLRREMSTLS